MKIGMNLLLWTTKVSSDHQTLLEQIKQWGFDGVEIPIFSPNCNDIMDLKSRLDDLGLERTAVTIVSPDASPIHSEISVRSRAVDYLKSILDVCYLADIRLLCGPLHSPVGGLIGRGRTLDEWKWGLEALQKVADIAQSAKVRIALEFLNRFESYFLNSSSDTVKFITEVNRPNVGILYDTYHAHLEEKNVSDAIRCCSSYLSHVHISENDRSTPGEGQVRWHETFTALKAVDYRGWLVIEAFGQSIPELAAATCIWRRMYPSEEHLARQGLNWIRTHLD